MDIFSNKNEYDFTKYFKIWNDVENYEIRVRSSDRNIRIEKKRTLKKKNFRRRIKKEKKMK